MTYTFDQFTADCRRALKEDDGPEGREKVRQNLEKLLHSDEFINQYCSEAANPGIETIHVDKETEFNVLVHVYNTPKVSPPHDHGISWAVYGQAKLHTDMTVWDRVDDGTSNENIELRERVSYRLEPGMAGRFEPGDIHTVNFPAGARFVRVTGTDLSTIPTTRYDLESKTATTSEPKTGN